MSRYAILSAAYAELVDAAMAYGEGDTKRELMNAARCLRLSMDRFLMTHTKYEIACTSSEPTP